jgi:hypothetical protein
VRSQRRLGLLLQACDDLDWTMGANPDRPCRGPDWADRGGIPQDGSAKPGDNRRSGRGVAGRRAGRSAPARGPHDSLASVVDIGPDHRAAPDHPSRCRDVLDGPLLVDDVPPDKPPEQREDDGLNVVHRLVRMG